MSDVAEAPSRLLSVDALRGFDMFWILGVEQLAETIAKAVNQPWIEPYTGQLVHASWEGFHVLDLVFPLFVFISGVSSVFSVRRSIEKSGRWATVRKIFVRAVLLFALGILYNHGLTHGFEEVRIMGVLQRIALCSFFTGLAVCFLRARYRALLFVALLVGYWYVMTTVAVPGVGVGHFEEGHNLADYLDRVYLPLHKFVGDHDPEGLLSTFPAIATCLLGSLAGVFLRAERFRPFVKVVALLLGGAAMAGLGWAWNLEFPVIKKIWTSSYVLVAGGYSLALLGLFYGLIDVRGWSWWAKPFIWIVSNAIVLYLSTEFIAYGAIANALVGGPIAAAWGVWGPVLIAAVSVLLAVLLARVLYVRKIFLRV